MTKYKQFSPQDVICHICTNNESHFSPEDKEPDRTIFVQSIKKSDEHGFVYDACPICQSIHLVEITVSEIELMYWKDFAPKFAYTLMRGFDREIDAYEAYRTTMYNLYKFILNSECVIIWVPIIMMLDKRNYGIVQKDTSLSTFTYFNDLRSALYDKRNYFDNEKENIENMIAELIKIFE